MTPLISVEPDLSIEPGHQWLVLPNTPVGQALAMVLTGGAVYVWREDRLLIPHDEHVDQRIVELINGLAHARYQSPALVQLTFEELR